jgi:hypothetical protein
VGIRGIIIRNFADADAASVDLHWASFAELRPDAPPVSAAVPIKRWHRPDYALFFSRTPTGFALPSRRPLVCTEHESGDQNGSFGAFYGGEQPGAIGRPERFQKIRSRFL